MTMPISSVIWKQTNLRSSQVGTLLFQKLYFNSQKNSLFSPANIKAPLQTRQEVGVLRHLSVTPSLQIFAKLTSLISKLAVEPDVPQRPLEHKTTSKVDSKIEELHNDITGSSSKFLEEYDKNLTDLVKQVEPLPKETTSTSLKGTVKKLYKNRERLQQSKKRIRFFHVEKPSRSTVTAHFKETYSFLQSLDIPCDELQYFPDIQRMTKEEIVMCIERLKSYGIQRVFSLFLIQRALAEMKSGISPDNPIVSGRKSVCQLGPVRHYLSLCKMLEQPDLDILSLLDKLIEANGYESITTVHSKVKKLMSVGATGDIIWNNLELMMFNRDTFTNKIKLYKRSRYSPDTPFPVALFLSKSFVAFKEGLSLGQDVLDIAEMLDIKVEEFQACWGHMKFTLPQLLQKVRMCIKVGIPKKDVFNNLSILNNIPLQNCYEVTRQFKESRLPLSIFIFREMDQANGINSVNLAVTQTTSGQDTGQLHQMGRDKQGGNSDWTGNEEPKTSNTADVPMQTDNSNSKTDGTKPLLGSAGNSKTITSKGLLKQKTTKKSTYPLGKYQVVSSKRSRKVLFHLVAHLLSLDPDAVSGMFRCNLSTSSVHRVDVTRNLDFLLLPVPSSGGGFTLSQVARCPLILLHPHDQLKAAFKSAPQMVHSYLASYALSSPPASTLASSSSPWDSLDEVDEREDRAENLDPLCEVEYDSEVTESSVDGNRSSKPASQPLLSTSSVKQPTTSFSTLSSSLSCMSALVREFDSKEEQTSDIQDFTGEDRTDPTSLTSLLFSCPIRHLNLVQYLLERECSFNLGANGTSTDSGLLNRPL